MRRRRPLSSPWSILVILALLWAQSAYAFHGSCTPVTVAGESAVADTACSSAAAPAGSRRGDTHATRATAVICDAHCAAAAPRGVDIAQPFPAPTLLLLPHRFEAATARAPPRRIDGYDGDPPRVRRHGPTGHPASLLLI